MLGCAAVIIIAALIYLKNRYKKEKLSSVKKNTFVYVKCPVCSSPLFKGENLYSKVFRPMNVSDQLCSILGCPNCYPKCKLGIKRICPVCKKEILQDGYLISRLFNKTKDGRKHIIVNGCINCSKNK